MDKKLVLIYFWIICVLIYVWTNLYSYKYGTYTENEKIILKKKVDVVRLPKILYDETTVEKLYNSISLEKEYNK